MRGGERGMSLSLLGGRVRGTDRRGGMMIGREGGRDAV